MMDLQKSTTSKGNPCLICDGETYYLHRKTKTCLTWKTTTSKIIKTIPDGDDSDENDGSDENDNAESKRLKGEVSDCIVTERPNVKFSDIAGLKIAKEAIQEAVFLPMRFPYMFQGNRKPWNTVLFYGPPGTGKTFLAKAVATESNRVILSVSSSTIMGSFLGDSEKKVKLVFETARKNKPSIIFFDELDSIGSTRNGLESGSERRVKTELLSQLQGLDSDNEGILIIGATNTPWILDSALRRRFQKRIYIGLPEQQDRETIIRLNLRDVKHQVSDKTIESVAKMTDGFSGSDLSILVKEAIMVPVRKIRDATHFKVINARSPINPAIFIDQYQPAKGSDKGAVEITWKEMDPKDIVFESPVTDEDLTQALSTSKRSTSTADFKQLLDFQRQFGQDG